MKSKQVGILWLIISIILFAVDIYAFSNLVKFYKNSEKTTGVVIDYKKTGGSRGGPSYDYTVQFKANDGRVYNVITGVGSHNVGDNLTVRYNKSNPEKSYASTIDLWIFVLLISFILLITALVSYSKLKNKE